MITWLFISIVLWCVCAANYDFANPGEFLEPVWNVLRCVFKTSTVLSLIGCGVRYINGGF